MHYFHLLLSIFTHFLDVQETFVLRRKKNKVCSSYLLKDILKNAFYSFYNVRTPFIGH